MFKNILIPTDGSKLSDKAIKHALALAKLHKAKITGVHVFSTRLDYHYEEYPPAHALMRERMRRIGMEQGKKYLDRIQRAAKSAGVKYDGVVVENDRAWEGIVNVARKKRCDLIAMAAHGRGAVSTLLLGSETNSVLAHSKVPVLVYR